MELLEIRDIFKNKARRKGDSIIAMVRVCYYKKEEEIALGIISNNIN